MKALIVTGDSWANNKYYEYANRIKKLNIEPFDHWTDILSDELELILNNIAVNGSGNEAIFNRGVNKLITHSADQIGYFIVVWSAISRMDIQMNDDGKFYTFNDREEKEKLERLTNKNLIDYYSDNYMSSNTLKINLDKTLTYIYCIQNICENLNIPYLQMFGIRPLEVRDTLSNNITASLELEEAIINHPIYEKLNSKTFVGWPVFERLGGHCLYTLCRDTMGNEFKISTSGSSDSHPNAKGCEFIANNLLENYIC
tara:strand:- start:632 stop:1402 length:771 start_codon:yes stop_codon:yes gene_type:complete